MVMSKLDKDTQQARQLLADSVSEVKQVSAGSITRSSIPVLLSVLLLMAGQAHGAAGADQADGRL